MPRIAELALGTASFPLLFSQRMGNPGEVGSSASLQPQLERGLGLKEAVALNMIEIVGIGPFVVSSLVIKAMGGPAGAHRLVGGCSFGHVGRIRLGRTRRGHATRPAVATFSCMKPTARKNGAG